MQTSSTDTATLWEQLHAELYAFLRGRVDSEAAAQDILQSAFLRAHQRLTAGDVPEHPRAWLYAIVRNLVVDARRHAGRQRALVQAVAADTGRDDERRADEDDAFAVVARTLPMFIDRLETPYRDALRMTELEGLTQAEAATRARVTLSGMKSRVQRGRKRILRALQRCCELELDARGRVTGCASRAPSQDCC